MYLKSLLFVSFAVFDIIRSDDVLNSNIEDNMKPEKSPYDLVSKCTPSILSRRFVDFDISEVINIGQFQVTHIVQGPQDLTCAKAVLYGDTSYGFKSSDTFVKQDGSTSTSIYSIPSVTKGVINQVLTDTKTNGKKKTYEFKIVINKWNKKLGVLYFTKCSDYGTGSTDIRTIMVQDCKYNNIISKAFADILAEDDAKSKYIGGSLKPLKPCPEDTK